MSEIRINNIPTTAASTASDDFFAIDGSNNNTRKLSAYSPTFGGNLVVNGSVVSGSGTSSFAGTATISGTASSDLLSYNLLLGGVKRLILGYDATNDYGLIASVHTGQAWKPLVINPIGGNVLIGTAIDGGQKFQVSGAAAISGNIILSTNNAYLQSKTSGGSTVNLFALTTDNLTRFINGVDANGGFQWTNQAQTVAWASLTSSLLSVNGNITVSGGSIINGAGTGVYYFGTPSNNYIYYDGSSLYTRVGGSDRMTISGSTGNVIIGTTSDLGQKLQVSGTMYVSGASSILGDLSTFANLRSIGATNTIRVRGNSQYIDFTNAAETIYVNGTIVANTLNLFGNNGTGLTIGTTGDATFAGSVKAASEVYAEKSGGGIAGQSVGLVTQFTTVNSTTYNVDVGSAKVFIVQLASGDAALCYTSYKSSTITILGSDGTIVNSSSPTSGQLGIYKSANNHVVSFKTGSNALASGYASWGFCFVGNPIISISNP